MDRFVGEKYHDQIATVLAQWSASLRELARDMRTLDKFLSPDFMGASLTPVQSKVVREGSALTVRKNSFSPPMIGRDHFLASWRELLEPLSNIITAEFQITGIETDSDPALLRTRIRYELVGSAPEFYREQRVGEWNIQWERSASREFRAKEWQPVEETVSRAVNPVFVDITHEALGNNPSYSRQLIHGADYWRTLLDGACGIDIYGHNGVSVGDIDNDGFDDLYVCQPAGLPNRLYRNRGDGTFEDVTEESGVGILENTACALFADINNDGRQDLVVVQADGPVLFVNEGGGKFRRVPDAFRFANPPQGTFTGAAAADYDRDGWLDIYFCLYTYYQGTDQYKYPLPYYDAENGPPNFLMRNNRDGTFSDVTGPSGLNRNNTRYSFCCGWNDYNGDGWPDLYVVNDFGRKNLYRNNGDGTFTDVAAQAGVEDVGAGMGVSWADYDNSGAEDLYDADMWTAAGVRISAQPEFQKDAPEPVRAAYRKHARGNSLFRNQGDGSLRDISQSAGIEMGRWSWSCDSWDFDHDGFPDLYVTNGMVSGPSQQDLNSFFWRQVVANSPVAAKPSHDYEQGWNAINELIRTDGTWSGYERNVFYANNRDGTFSDVSGAIGLDFVEDGRAFALADFDHDGRLECFLKNRNGPQLRVLKNAMKELGASIAFRLQGKKSNRDAIGAAVTVTTPSGKQTRTVQAGSGFLSQHSKDVFFGLGDIKGPVRAKIRWPSGLVQEIKNVPANHRIWIEEGAEPFRIEPFKDVSAAPRSAQAPPIVTETLPASVETWLLAPIRAPEFTLLDLNGKTWSLSAVKGRRVLLNFWSSRVGGLEEQLKLFQQAQRGWVQQGLELMTINVDDPSDKLPAAIIGQQFPVLRGSDDVSAVYNILYRYLFDRHRDLTLPTSFLIDENGDIVKVYQGKVDAKRIEEDSARIPRSTAERSAKGLPFPGVSKTLNFRRNYLSYGSVYFQRGYYEQAGASFKRALEDDPDSAEALYGMGSVYLKQDKNAEARESFERAVKLQAAYPDTLPNAWNNLGLLAAREGRAAEAEDYFREALQASPDHVIALVNLGNLHRQQKLWDQARTELERAVALSPDDPEANYSLAMVFAQTNNTERAYEYLQRAVKARPDYPEALNNLGILYLRTNRRDQAVATFQECMRVAPAFDQCYLNLARVYAVEGTPEKARPVLLELLKRYPQHPQAQKALAELGNK